MIYHIGLPAVYFKTGFLEPQYPLNPNIRRFHENETIPKSVLTTNFPWTCFLVMVIFNYRAEINTMLWKNFWNLRAHNQQSHNFSVFLRRYSSNYYATVILQKRKLSENFILKFICLVLRMQSWNAPLFQNGGS